MIHVTYDETGTEADYPSAKAAETAILEAHAAGVSILGICMEKPDGTVVQLGCEWSVKLVAL